MPSKLEREVIDAEYQLGVQLKEHAHTIVQAERGDVIRKRAFAEEERQRMRRMTPIVTPPSVPAERTASTRPEERDLPLETQAPVVEAPVEETEQRYDPSDPYKLTSRELGMRRTKPFVFSELMG